MIEFGAPLWLLGLFALPWLRWLHRSGVPLRARAVASLEPWPTASTDVSDGATRPPPDPAWWRRAAILALLLATLAMPRLPSGPPPLTVWIDDTPSLATIADGASRLERAQARLESAITQRADRRGEVEFRRFTRPPPPRALDPRREHWLLSDGSRAATADWLREAPITRVVAVDDSAGNVGLVRIAARASLHERGGLRVRIVIANGGNAAERRELEFSSDGRVRERRELALDPLAEEIVEFDVPEGTSRLAVRLLPGDSLASDDRIELSLDALAPLEVYIADDCPPDLREALGAHPALRLTTRGNGAVRVDCSDRRPPSEASLAQLRYAVDRPAPAGPLALQWSQATPGPVATAPALPTPRLRGTLDPRPAERLLASVDGAAVLLLSEGPPRVLRASLDPARGALGAAEHARWVAWLIETASGAELLGRVVATERPDDAVRVVPAALLPTRGFPTAMVPERAALSLARPLLALAVLLLAWELALQLRRIRRDDRSRSAVT